MSFDQFCIVELFGHQKIAGKVSEQVIAGQGFIRVDVPAAGDQPGFTRLYGSGAIYSIIPTTEEIVHAFVEQHVGAPITPYDVGMRQLPPRFQDDQDEYDHHY
ncbi:hypothetical protein JXJ21_03225 [candidate division KSB1 bacterium]|nr:hypothetical protein [candidate division KSB1 bacterium]